MITALVFLVAAVGVFAFQQYTVHNNLMDKLIAVRKELVSKEETLQSTFDTVDWYRGRLEDSGKEVMRLHKDLEATQYQLELSKSAAYRQYEELVGVKQNLAAYEVGK